LRAVSAAGVHVAGVVLSAPDDHLTAGSSPHCRVTDSGSGSAGNAGGCPTIGGGIVSTSGVKIDAKRHTSTPHDHLAASPHCRVTLSGIGGAGGGGRRPTIGVGIVSTSGVHGMMGGKTSPPHTIIWLPVHTAVGAKRPSGALVVVVGVQPLMPGLYLPPVFK